MKLKDLAERYNYTCCYCHKKWRLDELSREHIVPYRKLYPGVKGKGGGSCRGNAGLKNNLKLACKVCNLSKN